MSTAVAEPVREQFVIRHRNCNHRTEVGVEAYLEAAFQVPDCHEEYVLPELKYWRLSLPNAACTECTPAEKEWWLRYLGELPQRQEWYDREYHRGLQAYKAREALAHQMLASGASHMDKKRIYIGDLLALVGQTARVSARDYGCDGNPTTWTDDATITALCLPQELSVYDDYDREVGRVIEPRFDLSGMGRLCYNRALSQMQLVSP